MKKEHTNESTKRQNAKENFSAFLTSVAKAFGKTEVAHVDLRPAAKAKAEKAAKAETPAPQRSPELQAYLEKINKPEWHPDITDSPENRIRAAKALVSKFLSYGYKTRKSLLTYLKELEKSYSGFPLKAILSFGFKNQNQLHGVVGARVAELHKAQKPIVEELVRFSVKELENMIAGMSLKNLRTKYNVDLRPHEVEKLSGKPTLPKDVERDIEVTRRLVASWQRTRINEDNRKFRKQAKRVLRAREARRPDKIVTQCTEEYAKTITTIGAYIDEGLKLRRKWMNAIEARTLTTQKMSNLD